MPSKNVDRLEWASFVESSSPDQIELMAHADALMEPVQRNKSEAAFIEGEAICFLKRNAQKRTFSAWCRQNKFDRSGAYKRMDVFEKLAPFRSRLIAARVQHSALLELGRFPDRAEEIVSHYESGQQPTVEDVKALLGIAVGGNASDADVEIGGPKGIRRLHDHKRKHIAGFIDRAEGIIAAIDDALGADRLVKSHLEGKIVLEARWARLVLLNLCAFIEPVDLTYGKTRAVPFPEESLWRRVEEVLFDLGGTEKWPRMEALEPWLRGKVLPLLKWAARGENAGLGEIRGVEEQAVEAKPSSSPASEASLSAGDESYLLPSNFAFDGEIYEVMSEHAPGWHEATLRDGVWTSGGGEIRPRLIKLHRILITEGVRMMGEEYPPDMPLSEREEWRGTLARNTAAFFIYGEKFPFGSAPAEEPVSRIAAALIRDAEAANV